MHGYVGSQHDAQTSRREPALGTTATNRGGVVEVVPVVVVLRKPKVYPHPRPQDFPRWKRRGEKGKTENSQAAGIQGQG